MSCLDAQIALVPSNQLIVPSTLLAPATHIQTDKATKPQRYTLRPLTFELFFQNSSEMKEIDFSTPATKSRFCLMCPDRSS